MVGAPRFELGTSCAQGRRTISWKSFLFNLSFENKRVRKIFGSGTMYRNVAAHVWSPPNFPHTEPEKKQTTCRETRTGHQRRLAGGKFPKWSVAMARFSPT